MCCAFGQGGYTISSGANVLGSGGDFNGSESTEVCLNVEFGCTDATACNFEETALIDDGSCDFSCYGCTNPEACNYDPSATLDDGFCELPDPVAGCPTCDYPLSIFETGLTASSAGTPVPTGASGTLTSLNVSLAFANSGGGQSWPADLLIEIGLPDGKLRAWWIQCHECMHKSGQLPSGLAGFLANDDV